MPGGIMSWKLWLDDQLDTVQARKTPPGYLGATSSLQAINLVKIHGPPTYMDLDHDLGEADTAMKFLDYLRENYPRSPPDYSIHSMNPVGRKNIHMFMYRWISQVDLLNG
jgi:hypothetical protein